MKIAIISDIHEDYISLMQAARLIEKKKCDEVICLGDIVGFSVPFYNYINTRDGSACVKWVKNNCKYAIAGNHDLFAVRKVPVNQVRQFTYTDNWYNLTFHKRKEIAQERIWLYEDNELSALLDDEDMQFLMNLPEFMVTEIAGHTCLLSHFVFPDLSGSAKEFIYHYSDIVAHLGFMKEKHCTLGFSGHMHYEGMVRVSGKRMLKTGFGKKAGVGNFEWVSLPSVSNSKNANGFLVWDTENKILEPVSLRRKFNFI